MSVIRETIQKRSRTARMRMGQEVGEYVDIPSLTNPDDGDKVRVVLVPLNESELQQGLAYAAMDEDVPESFSGVQYRSRRSVTSDIWHACRTPDKLSEKVFESIEQMTELLDPSDIDYLNMHLAALMNYSSPSLDGLTDEDMDFLDQAWKTIQLKGLSGRQWAAAKVCLSLLLPELLQARSFGSTSTRSSTPTSESDESTSSALAS